MQESALVYVKTWTHKLNPLKFVDPHLVSICYIICVYSKSCHIYIITRTKGLPYIIIFQILECYT